jgi:hypothetical protein
MVTVVEEVSVVEEVVVLVSSSVFIDCVADVVDSSTAVAGLKVGKVNDGEQNQHTHNA